MDLTVFDDDYFDTDDDDSNLSIIDVSKSDSFILRMHALNDSKRDEFINEIMGNNSTVDTEHAFVNPTQDESTACFESENAECTSTDDTEAMVDNLFNTCDVDRNGLEFINEIMGNNSTMDTEHAFVNPTQDESTACFESENAECTSTDDTEAMVDNLFNTCDVDRNGLEFINEIMGNNSTMDTEHAFVNPTQDESTACFESENAECTSTDDTEAMVDNLFDTCDVDRNGLVAVSCLIEYLQSNILHQPESELCHLTALLDPEGQDIAVEKVTYRKIMMKWIGDIRSESGEYNLSEDDSDIQENEIESESLCLQETPLSVYSSNCTEMSKVLECDVTDLSYRLENLQYQSKKQGEDNVQLQQQIESQEEDITSLSKENQELSKKIKSLQEMSILGGEIQAENEQLKSILTSYQEIKRDLENRVFELVTDNGKLQDNIIDYQYRIQHLLADLNSSQYQVNQLENALMEQKLLLEQVQNIKSFQEVQLKESAMQNNELEVAVHELRKMNQDLKKEYGDLQLQLVVTQQELKNLENIGQKNLSDPECFEDEHEEDNLLLSILTNQSACDIGDKSSSIHNELKNMKGKQMALNLRNLRRQYNPADDSPSSPLVDALTIDFLYDKYPVSRHSKKSGSYAGLPHRSFEMNKTTCDDSGLPAYHSLSWPSLHQHRRQFSLDGNQNNVSYANLNTPSSSSTSGVDTSPHHHRSADDHKEFSFGYVGAGKNDVKSVSFHLQEQNEYEYYGDKSSTIEYVGDTLRSDEDDYQSSEWFDVHHSSQHGSIGYDMMLNSEEIYNCEKGSGEGFANVTTKEMPAKREKANVSSVKTTGPRMHERTATSLGGASHLELCQTEEVQKTLVSNQDPRHKFQAAIASTSVQNAFTTTLRKASLERQNAIPSQPLLSRESSSLSLDNSSEKTKEHSSNSSTTSKQGSQEEEAYQKGFEDGVEVKLGKELSDLREQQNSVGNNLEEIMEKVEHSEEEELLKENYKAMTNGISQNTAFRMPWDMSMETLRFILFLACIIFMIPICVVFMSIIPEMGVAVEIHLDHHSYGMPPF